MKMRLYKIVNTPKGIDKGELLGEVRQNGENTEITVADPKLKAKLEKLFSQPFEYLGAPEHGPEMTTLRKTALPGSPEFFKAVIFKLRDELKLIGIPE